MVELLLSVQYGKGSPQDVGYFLIVSHFAAGGAESHPMESPREVRGLEEHRSPSPFRNRLCGNGAREGSGWTEGKKKYPK